ncbi:MAG: YkgJ family cysteine cluster protein [Bacteroidota bacterium]
MADLIQRWQEQKDNPRHKKTKFIQKLRKLRGKELDELADTVHEEVFQSVDCLACANCCSSIPPMLNRTDIQRIAKHLGMKTAAFEETYLRMDEDGDMVMKETPCPFLLPDNMCLIYEYRPRACREYPHTDQQSFSKHLRLHKTNAQYCPGVFHILDRMEKSMNNH